MEYNKMKIEEVVEYINNELKKGRTMKDIEINDFNENKGVIQKRLGRKGYRKVNNQFSFDEKYRNTTKNNTRIIQKDNKQIYKTTENNTRIIHEDISHIENTTEKIQNNTTNKKAFSNDEINKLDQMLNLDIDILDKIIKDYKRINNFKDSMRIADSETIVTSIRVNKELYNKIKVYAKREKIKMQDIFTQMMINYLAGKIDK